MFKIRKTDMDPRESRFLIDTLNVLKERSAGAQLEWEGFTKDIKTVLDSRFGAEWNVLIGKSVGYSMKAKKKSSLVAAGTDGEIVICWKSPGFEVEDSEVVKIKAALRIQDKDTLLEGRSGELKLITIIFAPSADSIGYTPETTRGTF
jgi:hypothetical protein